MNEAALVLVLSYSKDLPIYSASGVEALSSRLKKSLVESRGSICVFVSSMDNLVFHSLQ